MQKALQNRNTQIGCRQCLADNVAKAFNGENLVDANIIVPIVDTVLLQYRNAVHTTIKECPTMSSLQRIMFSFIDVYA